MFRLLLLFFVIIFCAALVSSQQDAADGYQIRLIQSGIVQLAPVVSSSTTTATTTTFFYVDSDATTSNLCRILSPFDPTTCTAIPDILPSSVRSYWNLSCSAPPPLPASSNPAENYIKDKCTLNGGPDTTHTSSSVLKLNYSSALLFNISVDPVSKLLFVDAPGASADAAAAVVVRSVMCATTLDAKNVIPLVCPNQTATQHFSRIPFWRSNFASTRKSSPDSLFGEFYQMRGCAGNATLLSSGASQISSTQCASWNWRDRDTACGDNGDSHLHVSCDVGSGFFPHIDVSPQHDHALFFADQYRQMKAHVVVWDAAPNMTNETAAALCRLDAYPSASASTVNITTRKRYHPPGQHASSASGVDSWSVFFNVSCPLVGVTSLDNCSYGYENLWHSLDVYGYPEGDSFSFVHLDCGVPRDDTWSFSFVPGSAVLGPPSTSSVVAAATSGILLAKSPVENAGSLTGGMVWAGKEGDETTPDDTTRWTVTQSFGHLVCKQILNATGQLHLFDKRRVQLAKVSSRLSRNSTLYREVTAGHHLELSLAKCGIDASSMHNDCNVSQTIPESILSSSTTNYIDYPVLFLDCNSTLAVDVEVAIDPETKIVLARNRATSSSSSSPLSGPSQTFGILCFVGYSGGAETAAALLSAADPTAATAAASRGESIFAWAAGAFEKFRGLNCSIRQIDCSGVDTSSPSFSLSECIVVFFSPLDVVAGHYSSADYLSCERGELATGVAPMKSVPWVATTKTSSDPSAPPRQLQLAPTGSKMRAALVQRNFGRVLSSSQQQHLCSLAGYGDYFGSYYMITYWYADNAPAWYWHPGYVDEILCPSQIASINDCQFTVKSRLRLWNEIFCGSTILARAPFTFSSLQNGSGVVLVKLPGKQTLTANMLFPIEAPAHPQMRARVAEVICRNEGWLKAESHGVRRINGTVQLGLCGIEISSSLASDFRQARYTEHAGCGTSFGQVDALVVKCSSSPLTTQAPWYGTPAPYNSTRRKSSGSKSGDSTVVFLAVGIPLLVVIVVLLAVAAVIAVWKRRLVEEENRARDEMDEVEMADLATVGAAPGSELYLPATGTVPVGTVIPVGASGSTPPAAPPTGYVGGGVEDSVVGDNAFVPEVSSPPEAFTPREDDSDKN